MLSSFNRIFLAKQLRLFAQVIKLLPMEKLYNAFRIFVLSHTKTLIFSVLVFFVFMFSVSSTYAQLTGAKTIGVDYATLQAAISALNTSGVGAGGVVFNVPAGWTETFTTANGGMITATGTAANPIVFQKSGSGANPLITAYPIGIGSNDYVIAIYGGSYITIDGIDVQKNSPFVNGTQSVEYGYFIMNTASAGCKYNTIKNCTITLDHIYVSSSAMQFATIGIYQYTLTAPTSATLTNSYNTYTGNTIAEAYRGVYLNNTSSSESYFDTGNVFNNNTIGGSFVGSIGLVSSVTTTAGYTVGFQADKQENLSFYGNEVKNVQYYRTTSNTSYGVHLNNITGTTNVYNNKIHDIYNQYSSSGSTNLIYGLNVVGGTGCTVNIYNNFISKVNYAGTSGGTNRQTFACNISGSGTVNFYYNSLYLSDATASAAAVLQSTGVTINVVNNILKFGNLYLSSNRYVYCFYFVAGTLGISNYNNFDPYSTSLYNNTGYYSSNRSTLADWKTGSGKDADSKQFATNFISTTDLHLGITVDDPLYHGITISSPPITTDIDGQSRDTPLIGADEVIFCTKPTVYPVNGPYGNLCNNTAELRLQGNQSGVTYELYKGGVLVNGSAQVGTGGDDPVWNLTSAGTYTVKTAAVDGYCSLSMTGSVTVSSITPNITTHPSGSAQNLCVGVEATELLAAATGDGTLSYQWYSSTDNVNNTPANDIAVGGNSDSYTPSTATVGTLYYYFVVTNTCASGSATATSNVSGAITVNPSTQITTQPTDVSGCNSSTATIAATGTGTLTYQWQYSANGTSGWANVISGTPPQTSYMFPGSGLMVSVNPGYSSSGYYRCIVTGGCGSPVTSNVVSIAVATPPTISSLSSPTFCVGDNFNMTAPTVVANGSTIIVELFQIRTVPVPPNWLDITSPYTLTSADNGRAVRYRVNYTCGSNPAANLTTSNVTMTVNAKPIISAQPMPSGQSVCNNATPADITITASAGSGTISTYQWYSSTDATIGNADDVSVGTNSNTYTPPTATVGTMYYYCVVTNSNTCSTTSNMSGAIVVKPLPTLSSTQTPSAICSANTFSYTAQSGFSGVSFSWTRAVVPGISQGVSSGSDANISETLTNTTTSPVEVTYVYTMILNGCSNQQEVKVMVNPLPQLFAVSDGDEYCDNTPGVEITLDGSVVGTSYQLIYEGENIGAPVVGTENSITFGFQTQEGVYTVKAYNGYCYRDMTGSAYISTLDSPSTSTIYHE